MTTESSTAKSFGRSYTSAIDEYKKERESGNFRPREVHNKAALAVFLLVFAAMLGTVIYGAASGTFGKFAQEHTITVAGAELKIPSSLVPDGQWGGMLVAGSLVGMLFPVIFLHLLAAFPSTITWAACLLLPLVFVAAGVSMIAANHHDREHRVDVIVGSIWLFFGALFLFLNYLWREKIRFTAVLVRASTRLMTGHLSILAWGLLHAIGSLAWLLLSALCVVVLEDAGLSPNAAAGIIALPAIWGMLVFHYAYFVIAAGVIARWYFGETVAVAGAAATAWTYCLGCVCLGALLLAFVKILQMMAHAATHDDNGNPNACYFICRPLLDIIEWLVTIFNRFAFAVVGIYNMSFQMSGYEAVKVIQSAGLTVVAQDFVLGYIGFIATLMSTAVGFALLLPLSGTSLLGALPHGAVLGRHTPEGFKTGGTLTPAAAQTELWAFEVLVVGLFFGAVLDRMVQAALEGMTTALLVCFAESPSQLQLTDPEAHARLSERVSLAVAAKEKEAEKSVVTVV